MELRSRLIQSVLFAATAAVPVSAQCTTPFESRKLSAFDGVGGEQFGATLARQGDTLIVGAPNGSSGGAITGSVYVYERDLGGADAWGFSKELSPSDPAAEGLGYSVSLDGDRCAAGAPNGLFSRGQAFVFERDAGGPDAWGEVAAVSAFDGASLDNFGSSVSLSGDTLAVGAPGAGSGAVYLFQRDAGGPRAWGLLLQIPYGTGGFFQFGSRVLLSGDRLFVSAPRETHGAAGTDDAGSVRVYERDLGGPDAWGLRTTICAPVPSNFALFGSSIDLDGDLLAVGAPREGFSLAAGYLVAQGTVHLYQKDQGGADQWGWIQRIIPDEYDDLSYFGDGLELDGTRLAVGSSLFDDGAVDTGRVYVFERDLPRPGAWGQRHRILASDTVAGDYFGSGFDAIALEGEQLWAGANGADPLGGGSGATYLFDLPSAPPCAVPRNGNEVNLRFFTSPDEPQIGGTWTGLVDTTLHNGATLTLLFLYLGELTFPTAFGELLVDVTTLQVFVSSEAPQAGIGTHVLGVPSDAGLAGIVVPTQAAIIGSYPELGNALDLVLQL